MLTRRTSERRFFLRPDSFITQLFLYALGWAAERFNIGIVCVVVMSNHWHAVVIDHDAKLPRFVAKVHLTVAKCVNVFRGRWENVWASGRYNAVRLMTADDVLDRIVYVLANPVRAALVETAAEWPGLLLGPGLRTVDTLEAMRPTLWFRKRGRTPRSAALVLLKPACFDHLSDEAFEELVAKRLEKVEREVAAALVLEDRQPLGADAVLEQDWRDAPKTEAPRRVRHPHIAARDDDLRVVTIRELQQFYVDHERARCRWTRGRRRTRFPAGTYLMRVRYRVTCHPPPG